MYSRISSSLQKVGNCDTCYNVDVPKDIMLSEINQSQKRKTLRFHIHEVPRTVQFIKTEGRMVVGRGEGREIGKLLFNG